MSADIHDGGPAFPFGQVSETTGQPINGFFNPGMTLLDWFAGQAMVGWISSPDTSGNHSDMSKWCYDAADAMIKERNK